MDTKKHFELEMMVFDFKRLANFFESYHPSLQWKTKFHVLDHRADSIKTFGSLQCLNRCGYDRSHKQLNICHRKTSNNVEATMTEKLWALNRNKSMNFRRKNGET